MVLLRSTLVPGLSVIFTVRENFSGNFLLVLNFRKIYNPNYITLLFVCCVLMVVYSCLPVCITVSGWLIDWLIDWLIAEVCGWSVACNEGAAGETRGNLCCTVYVGNWGPAEFHRGCSLQLLVSSVLPHSSLHVETGQIVLAIHESPSCAKWPLLFFFVLRDWISLLTQYGQVNNSPAWGWFILDVCTVHFVWTLSML